jgi:hypothetical protein
LLKLTPLTVTISMQPFDQADQYPVVQAIQVETASLSYPALAGRVLYTRR